MELELLTDLDMLLLIERGIRGGISMISNRFGRANNKYMGRAFDNTKPSKFIEYLNANNLYGWAMCEPIPVKKFKRMTDFKSWHGVPCILEVDLENPEELHDLHNDCPLAPESAKVNRVEKLIPNLYDKEKYVIHHQNLKQYILE